MISFLELDFLAEIDGQRVLGSELTADSSLLDGQPGETQHHISRYEVKVGIVFERHTVIYEHENVVEHWVVARNIDHRSIRISRLDSVAFSIPENGYDLMYFRSGWGQEFESVREPLTGQKVLFNQKGRSSNALHPWFSLFGSNGELLTGSIAWSGNWIVRFLRSDNGGYNITAGLDSWKFHKDLAPNDLFETPHVVLTYAKSHDLNQTSIALARVGRRYWYPRNAFSDSLAIEWNHWWSYEDKNINESVFLANVDRAANLGYEVCTLDAGWFGPSQPGSDWYPYRGDWERVNTVRFPHGIRYLSDYVHSRGMKFGLWCEIEAVGASAELGIEHPDFVALRDGEPIGYVCFGNPDVQDWAYQTLDRLITEYNCDWIKLDFNLDPLAGCNRTDHGHCDGDGLYEHYRGYYGTLARVREKHPNIILENCSSGGLRIDLGMMQQTHTTFLSDPDWPEHGLQLLWGASTMLAPNACLHWGYSDWISRHPPQQFNPHDPNLKQHQLDYYVRISMLCGRGSSQKLVDLPNWVSARLKHHADIYHNCVRRFVLNGDLYRLTEQPKHQGQGERWSAFQYSLPDESEHLLYVFRLHNSEDARTIHLRNLQSDRVYRLTWLSEDKTALMTGLELMQQGITFTDLLEEDSNLISIC